MFLLVVLKKIECFSWYTQCTSTFLVWETRKVAWSLASQKIQNRCFQVHWVYNLISKTSHEISRFNFEISWYTAFLDNARPLPLLSAPDFFSVKTFYTQLHLSASICNWGFWSRVETRAYPMSMKSVPKTIFYNINRTFIMEQVFGTDFLWGRGQFWDG